MVNSLPKALNRDRATDKAIQETLLTPRFYTTDFDVAANLDLSPQAAEFEAMRAEMRADYNRNHFVRDEVFDQSWEQIDGKTRQAFIDYLERSCVSEFSGFLLFKELSRKLKNRSPALAEMFHLMARDEARHAGFLNKAMGDFNRTMDLGYLTKARSYTFFPVNWIIYTVYLSEKIGYWRYIIIFHHLEQHPEHQFYPLFRYFESWCQDENRHGDIFKVLLRSQPQLWNNWRARLWIRFFLLMVFATHTMTVHERSNFYGALGLDAREFDRQVVEKTNATAGNAFPIALDTAHPQFFVRLHRCADLNLKIAAIEQTNRPKWLKSLQKLPYQLTIGGHLLRLYLLAPKNTEALKGTVR